MVDYSIIGVIVFMVMAALGEMTSFAPMSRKFTDREHLGLQVGRAKTELRRIWWLCNTFC